MAKSQSFDAKFLQLAALVLLTAAAGLAALWAPAVKLSHYEAGRLLEEGRHASGTDAETDFQLATMLDPGNPAAHIELARLEIASGRSDDALDALAKAGHGIQSQRLMVRTLIELGRNNSAADQAAALAQQSGAADEDLTLAAYALLLAGRTSDATALAAQASGAAAAAAIQRAAASPLVLASALYAQSLPKSAAATLQGLPPSYERNLLLARVDYSLHSRADLDRAGDLLTSAITLNPTAADARALLIKVDQDRRNYSDAGTQAALLKRLEAGRP